MSGKVPEVLDESKRPVRLGPVLGQGGEGAVYEIPTRAHAVAKVYHKPLSVDRAAKIAAMITMQSEALSKLAAWPQGLLSDRSGKPIGLVMPRVAGRKDIHHLYSPKSRRSDFQRADWRFLVHATANTARAFAAVHEASCVIGDVNHGGVLVGQDATVKLIDCDSFQVTHAGRRFLCEVGVETFTPPELQGKSFAGIIRTPNHDNFGLAVMAFLMLFMGRHPFAGRYLGAGDMPIAKAIEEFRFAYGARHQQLQMTQPPGTPSLGIVGSKVALLFERAFTREAAAGGRPTAREWIEGLDALGRELKRCSANAAHWHHPSVGCPWCPMEGKTGVPLFGLTIEGGNTSLFDIVSFWKQVAAVPHPGPAPAIQVETVMPSEEAKSVHRRKMAHLLVPAFVAIAFFIATIEGGGGWVFGMGAAAAFALYSMLDPKDRRDAIIARRNVARTKWDAASATWVEKAGPKVFDQWMNELHSLRSKFEAGPLRKREALDGLKRQHRQLQLNAFLDRFEIASATIPSVGAGRKQTLESFGIESALDVTPSALASVPGFGPKTQEKLLDWRREIERKFVFNPIQPIDQKATQKVEADHRAEMKVLEVKLTQGLAQLRKANAEIRSVREHMQKQVEEAANELAQAEADYKVV